MIDYLGDQTKNKAVHELPEYNLDTIKKQVLDWVANNTDFLDDKTSEGFWMKIDYKDLESTMGRTTKRRRMYRKMSTDISSTGQNMDAYFVEIISSTGTKQEADSEWDIHRKYATKRRWTFCRAGKTTTPISPKIILAARPKSQWDKGSKGHFVENTRY